MLKPLHPVLRRTEIQPIVGKYPGIFNKDTDIFGILMPLWIDEDQILPCFAPRLLRISGSGIATLEAIAGSAHLDPTRQLILARILLQIMADNPLHAALERHVDEVSIPVDIHQINALIFANSVILSHDDPSSYIYSYRCHLENELHEESTRSSLCSILIPEAPSNHAALQQSNLVAKDFADFRRMGRNDFADQLADLGLELTAPTAQEIQNAKREK